MTDKPRFTISLNDEVFDRVETYRYERKFSTRSRAVAHLIEMALGINEPKEELTKDEKVLLEGFRCCGNGNRDVMLLIARNAIREKV